MSALVEQQHWQRPDQLQIRREPGFAYRFIKKTDVERRLAEGWVVVESKLRTHKEGSTSVERAEGYRSLILMRMPQQMANERNAHYRDRHNKRLRAVARGGRMASVARAATSEGTEREDGSSLASTIGKGLQINQGVITNDGLVHTDNINIPVHGTEDDTIEDAQAMEELSHAKKAAPEEPVKASAKKKNRR